MGRPKKPIPEPPTMTPDEFRALRLKLGYRYRSDLAAALGVSKRAIEHWEYGRRKIPGSVIKLLECLSKTHSRPQ